MISCGPGLFYFALLLPHLPSKARCGLFLITSCLDFSILRLPRSHVLHFTACLPEECLPLARGHRQGSCPRWCVLQVRCNSTSSPGEIGVHWLTFAGFYEKKIIKDFVQSAHRHQLTGFLAHGKPAVACLEGSPDNIITFLRHVRTTVFATVPRSARKMSISSRESSSTSRLLRFQDFKALAFFSSGAHHRSDMLDRKQLDAFLLLHCVPVEVRRKVLMSGIAP